MFKLYQLSDMSYSNSLSPYVVTIENTQGDVKAAEPCDHLAIAQFVAAQGWFVDCHNLRYARDWLVRTGHLKMYYREVRNAD